MKLYIMIILSLLLLKLDHAYSAQVTIQNCLTAQVDAESLNVFNKKAYEIFPYSSQDTQISGVQKLSSDELNKKYLETLEDKDAQVKYEKLVENLQLYFLSGGVTITSAGEKLKQVRPNDACSWYSSGPPLTETVSLKVPNLSPLLSKALTHIRHEAAVTYQDTIIGAEADERYYLVFGYNAWGEKNRKEWAIFEKIMACTLDQVIDQLDEVSKATNCEEVKKTPLYGAFRVFLTSAILNYALITKYVSEPYDGVLYGFDHHALPTIQEKIKKLRYRPWLGGEALNIMRRSDTLLDRFYEAKTKGNISSK